MRSHNRYFYFALLLTAAMFWGSAYPAVRFLVLDGVDPYLIAALRLTVTFLFSTAMLLFSRERFDFPAFRAHFWPFFFMSLTGGCGFLCFMCLGLQFASAGKSALIVGCNPIFIVLLSYFYLQEPLPRAKLIGIVIAMAGVVFTVTGAEVAAGKRLVLTPGDLLLFAACLCWVAYTIVTRGQARRLGYWQGMFLMFGISFILVLPLLVYFAPEIAALTAGQWLWIGYMGVAVGGVGFYFWSKCLNVLGASVCGMFNSFMPVFSILFAALFLRETLAWLQLLGGALVMVGVLLGMRRARLPLNYETGESL